MMGRGWKDAGAKLVASTFLLVVSLRVGVAAPDGMRGATPRKLSSVTSGPYAGPGKGCPMQQPFPEMPLSPVQLNGIAMPDMCIQDASEAQVFIMGDYGGITCGDKATRGPKDPNGFTCKKKEGVYVKTADNTEDHDDRGRYHVVGADDMPQQLVAEQMRKRAAKSMPHNVLNGGDNFYFGGLDLTCCQPFDKIHNRTRLQFEYVFERMYEGIDAPFFSVLGNHDFGGRHFNAAWDQQVAYTWAEDTTGRWIMPSFYWKQRVNYPAGNFSIDYFMVDTNQGDAKPFGVDTKHNICGGFNDASATCKSCGGPNDRYSCPKWFDALWRKQSAWLEKGLNESTADWQIVVTHFPPDQFNARYWTELHKKYGIDLFVGSHRHTEEVHMNDRRFGGLSWVVVGGGGGITSEWNPDLSKRGRDQYGFMDMTITKTELRIEALSERGETRSLETIAPVQKRVEQKKIEKTDEATNVEAPPLDVQEQVAKGVFAIPTEQYLLLQAQRAAYLLSDGAPSKPHNYDYELPLEPAANDYDLQVDPAPKFAVDSGSPSAGTSWSSYFFVIGGASIVGGVVLLFAGNSEKMSRRHGTWANASPESAALNDASASE